LQAGTPLSPLASWFYLFPRPYISRKSEKFIYLFKRKVVD
jgi:hypothetical protein